MLQGIACPRGAGGPAQEEPGEGHAVLERRGFVSVVREDMPDGVVFYPAAAVFGLDDVGDVYFDSAEPLDGDGVEIPAHS
ncbi:hypothetical protein IFR05_007931 [Cadophora sp. M221]|nr:hypothetical protein IFR05_007931 [Cadophora sp. M221]